MSILRCRLLSMMSLLSGFVLCLRTEWRCSTATVDLHRGISPPVCRISLAPLGCRLLLSANEVSGSCPDAVMSAPCCVFCSAGRPAVPVCLLSAFCLPPRAHDPDLGCRLGGCVSPISSPLHAPHDLHSPLPNSTANSPATQHKSRRGPKPDKT